MNNPATEKAALRSHFRQLRKRLSLQQRTAAAAELCRQLGAFQPFQTALRVALYHPVNEEIDPRGVLTLFAKAFFLPVVDTATQCLQFAAISDNTLANRYGIPEPADTPRLPALEMDVVLMPLLAFDTTGHRLGMGGGYYDRSLAGHLPDQKPLLIGLGYACQQAQQLPCDSWDVKLDAVITEQGVLLTG